MTATGFGRFHVESPTNRNDGFLRICSKNLPMENGIRSNTGHKYGAPNIILTMLLMGALSVLMVLSLFPAFKELQINYT